MFAAALTPALLLLAAAFGVAGRRLGPDPVEDLLLTCGKTALNLLWITLAVTPVAHILRRPQLLRLRRMLGLFAFFYALVHFSIYVVLDRSLDVAMIIGDIGKRPYITIGFTALVLLVPLAVTSTSRMMRRLGRRWQRLHRLVYAIAILGAWHFYWKVKSDVTEQLIYDALLDLLLGWRIWHRRRALRATPLSAWWHGNVTALRATLSPGRTLRSRR